MSDRFFGYGSLVNTKTHNYQNTRPAQISGWRRTWVQSSTRNVAFLSVTPDPLSRISGLTAEVGNIGWAALDQRESAYDRLELDQKPYMGVKIYRASASAIAPENRNHPILLSYLDCVVQGFHEIFGEDGVRDFFRSTTGWHTPILNDRQTPIYPRAQTLSDAQIDLVEKHLTMVDATILTQN